MRARLAGLRLPGRIALHLAALALMLAACQGAAGSAPQTPSPAPPRAAPTAQVLTPSPVAARCTVVSPRPTPGPTEQSLFRPVNETDRAAGPESAALTIIEYGDYQ